MNPVRSESTVAPRRRLRVDIDLPMREAYSRFITEIIQTAQTAQTALDDQ